MQCVDKWNFTTYNHNLQFPSLLLIETTMYYFYWPLSYSWLLVHVLERTHFIITMKIKINWLKEYVACSSHCTICGVCNQQVDKHVSKTHSAKNVEIACCGRVKLNELLMWKTLTSYSLLAECDVSACHMVIVADILATAVAPPGGNCLLGLSLVWFPPLEFMLWSACLLVNFLPSANVCECVCVRSIAI